MGEGPGLVFCGQVSKEVEWMTKEEVEDQVKKIIVEKFQIAEDKVTTGAKLDADLGADSLDLVDLMMVLEDKFSMDISDEEASEINTVGDIVEYISKKNGA